VLVSDPKYGNLKLVYEENRLFEKVRY